MADTTVFRILIADDHQLMLEGIRMALADAADIEIVGETSSGAEVLPLVRQTYAGPVEFGEDGMTIDVGETINIRRLPGAGR